MQYVAFLRGINVGGRTIRMTDLKASFEGLGLEDVTTILQSGNVIFTSKESVATLKRVIETGLTSKFDYPAHVQVMTIDSLKSILASYPFTDDDTEYHNYVVFFEDSLEKQLAQIVAVDTTVEQLQVGVGVIYWRVPKGLTLKSQFAQYLTKSPFKNTHTNRNIRTLRKVVSRSL
jgi:uncharacterized protein (DUF1697 family)